MTRQSKLFLFALASQLVIALVLKEIYSHTRDTSDSPLSAVVEAAPPGSVTKDILNNTPLSPQIDNDFRKARVTRLMQFAGDGKCAELEALIRAGEDVHALNTNGTDALIYAASAGHIACVKILLAAGANTSTVDRAGDSALSAARQQGFGEIVTLIQSAPKP
jgi:ankyrin repeat protein